MGDGGKGSAPRPFSVDLDTFGSNFDTIFRKKYQELEEEMSEEELDEDEEDEDDNPCEST